MRLKKSYFDDMRYFDETYKRVLMVLFTLALFMIPLFTGGYLTYILNIILINIIVTVGLNILMGCAGQVSLGHAAFFAIGAYSSVILNVQAGFPFWIALILSGVITTGAGLIVGIPALRLKGLYLAIATMSFAFIIEEIIVRWRDLTQGLDGLSVPDPTFGPWTLDTEQEKYWLILVITLILLSAGKNILRSNIGRAFVAIKDNDVAAETMGISLTKFKIMAFGVSAFYTGIGGSLLAYLVGFISPENFNIMVSIGFIVMVIVGGPGSILGSILGAIFITFLPEGIRIFKDYFPQEVVAAAGLQGIVYGAVMVGFVMFEPQGLNGIWIRLKLSWRTFPFGRKIKRRKLMVHGVG